MNCPHCSLEIELVEINCGVLRCGIYQLLNGKIRQLPKHASKKKIVKLKSQIVIGCGYPIRYSNGKLIKCSWES